MKQRGFTLLEIAVSLVLMIIVVGVATGVMATVLRDNRRQAVLSTILRDASFATTVMNSELRQAGLGVPPAFSPSCIPNGFHIRRNCTPTATGTALCEPLFGTSPKELVGLSPAPAATAAPLMEGLGFSTAVIVASANQVGVVADLPRPDGQYSTYGPLHSRPTGLSDTGSANYIVWHNENNGACAPGNGCTLKDFSTFFADGQDVCAAANPLARTCPWGLNRVRAGESIQIVAGDGKWSHAVASAPLAVQDVGGGRLALTLGSGFDLAKSDTTFADDGRWANRADGDGPGGIRGQGWVTTLDRVFFFHDAATKTLQRVQCFGDPDPNHASWPAGDKDTMPTPSNLQLTPATSGGVPAAQNQCVGPDVIARNVDSVVFKYWTGAAPPAELTAPVATVSRPTCTGPPTAGKNAIRRIDYTISFKATVDGRDVTDVVRGSVRLQNL